MTRSPLERMIDQACEVPKGAKPKPMITLRCPQCKREKIARMDRTDPPGTYIVQALCNRCDDGGGFPEVLYFDAAGKQLEVL